MEKDEKRAWIIQRSLIAIICVIFFLAGFVIPPNDVTATLWDALHPMSWYNFVGIVLFLCFPIGMTGIFSLLLPTGSTWLPKALWVCGFVGVLLMFAP